MPETDTRPFVFLEWWDSRTTAQWIDEDVELHPAVCRSVGWVIAENEDYVALAGTWSPTIDEFAAVVTIPRACIQKRVDLAWPEVERLRHYPRVIAELKKGLYADRRVCVDIERQVAEAVSKGGE